jgi:peptide/nickel transport system substrate-binding protein
MRSGTARAAPVRGGTLRIATNAATTIEPPDLVDEGGIGVVQPVGEYLVAVDRHLIPRPWLATRWQPNADFTRWTFTLRQGVRFHSGTLMTAADVVATFKRLVDPRNHHAAARSSLAFLTPEGVTAVDPSTVAFQLTRPVADFPLFLNTTYQAVILPAAWPGSFAQHPDGTGPFRLFEYIPQQRARYVRNPTYWATGLPYLDRVEVLLGLSQDGQVLALRGDSADVQLVTDPTLFPVLRADPAITILSSPSGSFYGIFMRCDAKPFDDKRVRQALALALNRPAMVKTLTGGLGVVGDDNVVSPVYPAYTPIPQRTQDDARARALLAAAGYPDGLTATLTTASVLAPVATVAQRMWAGAGITITLNPEPETTYYQTDWLQAPLTLTAWAFRPALGQLLTAAFSSDGIWNASHWKSPAFDRLARAYDATNDPAARKTIAHGIEQIMTEQTPAIIPYFSAVARAIRRTVHGVSVGPNGFIDLRQVYLSSS